MASSELYPNKLLEALFSNKTFTFPNHRTLIDILEENDILSEKSDEISYRNAYAATMAHKKDNGYMFLLDFMLIRDQFEKSNPEKQWVSNKALSLYYDIANVLIKDPEVLKEATNSMRRYKQPKITVK